MIYFATTLVITSSSISSVPSSDMVTRTEEPDGNRPVKVAPHVTIGGDDVATAAIDGGICAALVTLLLDGGAGDYSQQDDEDE